MGLGKIALYAAGGWAVWRALGAQKAGVPIIDAITNPLTPLEQLRPRRALQPFDDNTQLAPTFQPASFAPWAAPVGTMTSPVGRWVPPQQGGPNGVFFDPGVFRAQGGYTDQPDDSEPYVSDEEDRRMILE